MHTVHATPGIAGYRLGAGAKLPPLLLDDDEAIAVAIGLHTAVAGTAAGPTVDPDTLTAIPAALPDEGVAPTQQAGDDTSDQSQALPASLGRPPRS